MFDFTTDLLLIAGSSILFIGLISFHYFRSCLLNQCAEISQQITFESTFSNGLADWNESKFQTKEDRYKKISN